MEKIRKSIYFDYKLFFAFTFVEWTKLTFSKYKNLILVLLGQKNTILNTGRTNMQVSSIEDIGTVFSSLSDEYFHVYKILGNNVKTVVDVGANIGQFSNAIKTWYPQANIHAFEPDPQVFEILESNLSSDNVTLYNYALSEKKETLKFYKSQGSLVSSIIKTKESKSSITVDAVPLDGLIKDIKSIDLFKIDVEGAEINVLKGAHKTLKKSKYLLIEMSFERPTNNITNLDVLNEIYTVCPKAEILHIGRGLGGGGIICAQDFLIKLNNT
jgi:FkbM family methyltransferase